MVARVVRWGSAKLGEGLALLGGGAGSGDASPLHEPLVGGDSAEDVGLGVVLLEGPGPLGEGAGADPYFDVVDVLVAELAPQAHLCAQHVLLVVVVLDEAAEVDVVEVEPGEVVAVGDAEVVADAHVEVEGAVLGDDHLVLGGRQGRAPPVDDVIVLDLDLVDVHPVHELLVGVELPQDLVLFAAVVDLHLEFADLLLQQEVGLVLEAGQHHLVAAQVHDRVGEDVEDLGEHLPHQRVGPVQSDVQRPHEAVSVEGARHALVLRRQTPARSVAGGVQLGHHSHSSLEPVQHHFPCLLRGVGLLGRVGGVPGDFGVRVEDQGEGVLVDDVPVQHVHLVVHHGVYRLQDQMQRQEVPRTVDHQSSVVQGRLVSDHQRQPFEFAVFGLVARAIDRLQKRLERTNEPNVGSSCNFGSSLIDIEFVLFLFEGECALEGGVLDGDVDDEVEADEGGCELGRDDVVGDVAVEGLLHLELDEFAHVLAALLLHLHVVEDLAGVGESDVVGTAHQLVGHGQEIEAEALGRVSRCQARQQQPEDGLEHFKLIKLGWAINYQSQPTGSTQPMQGHRFFEKFIQSESVTPWDGEENNLFALQTKNSRDNSPHSNKKMKSCSPHSHSHRRDLSLTNRLLVRRQPLAKIDKTLLAKTQTIHFQLLVNKTRNKLRQTQARSREDSAPRFFKSNSSIKPVCSKDKLAKLYEKKERCSSTELSKSKYNADFSKIQTIKSKELILRTHRSFFQPLQNRKSEKYSDRVSEMLSIIRRAMHKEGAIGKIIRKREKARLITEREKIEIINN